MRWSTHIVSLVSLILAKMAIGGISLSLTLIAVILFCSMAVLGIVLLALCGLCFLLERLGWLRLGWTDKKLLRLKEWARETPGRIAVWKQDMRNLIIQYLEEKGDQEDEPLAARVRSLEAAVVSLVLLLIIFLVKHYLGVSLQWAILIVGALGLVVGVGAFLLHMRKQMPDEDQAPAADTETAPFALQAQTHQIVGTQTENGSAPESATGPTDSLGSDAEREMLKKMLSGRLSKEQASGDYGITAEHFDRFCNSLVEKGVLSETDRDNLVDGGFVT
ncbi:hypothetical protein ACFL2Q_02715 [Thermodesulfobacteriota bacterium]